ncbi:MAG TPA: hypothetical protein PLV21_12640 [Cyclobacteriaceae bacterium]|nr:hypothetical protein [Cyclobacteriaceae bacterium]HRJ82730.1 hypothetical protein [Cyclobacteriaceae bacterium]
MKKGLKIVMWIVLGTGFVGLVAMITMQLWNWLVPELFSGPAITFWQALGLLVLSKILFSGIGGKRGHSAHWKHRYSEKWSAMTPEERARFKERMKDKWCRSSSDEITDVK